METPVEVPWTIIYFLFSFVKQLIKTLR